MRLRNLRWAMPAVAMAAGSTHAQPLTVDPPAANPPTARALTCLTAAIAYEAGYEPREGQEAVAEVILNRLRDPLFPKSVCGVVFQGSRRSTGCQFTFTCDGALRRRLPAAVMATSRSVAEAALAGLLASRTAGATNYHANYVTPYWADSLVVTARIGAHIFYRKPGAPDFGRFAGLTGDAGEPVIAALGDSGSAAAPVATPLPPPPAFAPWGLRPPGN